MSRKSMFWLCVISLFLVTTAMLGTINMVKADPTVPKIYVEPQTQTVSSGESFNVTVKIDNAKDLFTWGLKMRWHGPVLNVTDVLEGAFLQQGGDTAFLPVWFNGPDPDGDPDYIVAVSTLLLAPAGVTGNGTLMTVKFIAESEGETTLHIWDPMFKDFMGTTLRHGVEDGYVNLTPPTLSVFPASVRDPTLVPGSTFSVSVNISNVLNLRSFEFTLGYSAAVLSVNSETDIVITPFLPEPVSVNKQVSATGYVRVNATSTAADTVSGNGTLATITFTVTGVGESVLDLYGTKLDDEIASLFKPNNAPAVDGSFWNMAGVHDISVKKVWRPSPIKVTVGQSVSVNVTVSNLGDFTETFDVTVFYDGNVIEKRTGVTLEVGMEKTLQFTWDTDVPPGSYTIKAVASTVAGETSTTDNTFSYAFKVTVEQLGGGEPDTFLYAVGGIVVVVVAATLIYFLKFRKSK